MSNFFESAQTQLDSLASELIPFHTLVCRQAVDGPLFCFCVLLLRHSCKIPLQNKGVALTPLGRNTTKNFHKNTKQINKLTPPSM